MAKRGDNSRRDTNAQWREAMRRIEERRAAARKVNEFNARMNSRMEADMEDSGFQQSFGGEYSGSKAQREAYERLADEDQRFADYVRENYGSYENYLNIRKILELENVYNPNIHYIIDVNIVTEEKAYRTDHISADQVILEALSGVVTVVFMKNDGSVRRLTGTLQGSLIPNRQNETRKYAFSPMRGDRILIWDLNENGWKSFYMERVIKFVRDDTIGLE
jgi:hypothetical protein